MLAARERPVQHLAHPRLVLALRAPALCGRRRASAQGGKHANAPVTEILTLTPNRDRTRNPNPDTQAAVLHANAGAGPWSSPLLLQHRTLHRRGAARRLLVSLVPQTVSDRRCSRCRPIICLSVSLLLSVCLCVCVYPSLWLSFCLSLCVCRSVSLVGHAALLRGGDRLDIPGVRVRGKG